MSIYKYIMKGRGLAQAQQAFQESSDAVEKVPVLGPLMDIFIKPIAGWLKMSEKPPPPPPSQPVSVVQHGL